MEGILSVKDVRNCWIFFPLLSSFYLVTNIIIIRVSNLNIQSSSFVQIEVATKSMFDWANLWLMIFFKRNGNKGVSNGTRNPRCQGKTSYILAYIESELVMLYF